MRSANSLAPTVLGLATAFTLAAVVVMAPDLVAAESTPSDASTPCDDCRPDGGPMSGRAAAKPEPRPRLDDSDRLAALEALQLALSEVGDGASYVWHARTGRVSGVVKPTQSYKDQGGRICRHVVVVLSAASRQRQTEGVACRLATGIWQLEG